MNFSLGSHLFTVKLVIISAHLQNYVFVHEHNVPAGILIDGSCQARLPERFLEGSEKFQVASQRRRYGPNGEEKPRFPHRWRFGRSFGEQKSRFPHRIAVLGSIATGQQGSRAATRCRNLPPAAKLTTPLDTKKPAKNYFLVGLIFYRREEVTRTPDLCVPNAAR